MISNSVRGRFLIRLFIVVFRYTPFIYTTALAAVYYWYGCEQARQTSAAQVLWGLILAEILFFCFIYLPYMHQLNRKAVHPTPLTSEERWALFNQCLANVQSMEVYLRWWFLGAEIKDIRRDNLRDFLLWGFFDQAGEDVESNGGHSEADARDLDSFITKIEERLGHPLRDGRGTAKCIRLTLDDVEVTYRSLTWYLVIYLVDQAAHLALSWNGFKFYGRGPVAALATFPPRPQEIFTSRRSRAPQLSYWYRPHASKDCNPVVFFHGIGVGLWTYVDFLANIHAAKDVGGGQGIGVIAVEILPVSFRLTSPPLGKAEFLRQMAKILEHHQWDKFTVTAHSYGSVQTTHMLHSQSLGHMITSVVLIDPVTVMLHLPDVAYNFTRRKPREANEWLLWYFASTDPGVARCLGRHFFWRENIIWKEDFRNADPRDRRKVAVCLAGRDILVNTSSVAQYLTDLGVAGISSQAQGANQAAEVEVLMFPNLDHAQIFDTPADCQKVIRLIRSYCSAGLAEYTSI
ncbi:Alpha/Beta hydrolase protein [Trichoderma sp. SZMC 28015]